MLKSLPSNFITCKIHYKIIVVKKVDPYIDVDELFQIEKIFFLRKVTPPQSQKVAENAGFGSTLIHMRYIYISKM